MWKPDKYIFVAYKGEVVCEDLDLTNNDEIFGRNDDGHNCDSITIGEDNVGYPSEVQEINIDTAIAALNRLKENDCNYVEIMHHVDHHGYHFIGMNMSKANETQVQLMELQHKNEEISSKKLRIAELKNQLIELEKNDDN